MKTAQENFFDIIIVGAGLVGTSFALALCDLPLKIAIIESRPWQEQIDLKKGRHLALNFASQQFFSSLGLWPELESFANPICTVHVSEKNRFGLLRFKAEELNLPALGYLIPEPGLVHTLEKAAQTKTNLTWFRPCEVKHFEHHVDHATLQIKKNDSTKSLSARLVIAADGIQSSLRKALHISSTIEPYDQAALVTQVQVSHPEALTAFERFTSVGTLALMPRKDHSYGVIITASHAQIEIWKALDDEAFLAQLQDIAGYRLGRLSHPSPRQIYPLSKQIANKQSKLGVILLGNAAHTFHPIAAQGLNLSLQDVMSLSKLIETQKLHSIDTLCQLYESSRIKEQEKMINMTDSIVTLFTHPSFFVRQSRHVLLSLMAYTPLKKWMAYRACGF